MIAVVVGLAKSKWEERNIAEQYERGAARGLGRPALIGASSAVSRTLHGC